MAVLPFQKRALLREMFSSMPIRHLESLSEALSYSKDPKFSEVAAMIATEESSRRLRDNVFTPFSGFFLNRDKDPKYNGKTFPYSFYRKLWAILCEREDGLIPLAVIDNHHYNISDAAPYSFLGLIKSAAALCRLNGDDFKDVRSGEIPYEMLEDFAAYCDLYRLAVDLLGDIKEAIFRPDATRSARLRIVFRHAADIHEDGAVRLMEIAYSYLKDPASVLKIISILLDRPSDRFLVMSEMATFGERSIARTENFGVKLTEYRRQPNFSQLSAFGLEASQALKEIHAIQDAIELTKDGPLGKRLSATQGKIIDFIEETIKSYDRPLKDVFPFSGSKGRSMPRVDGIIKPESIERLKNIIEFCFCVQPLASTCGYLVILNQAFETMGRTAEDFFDGLLELANADNPPSYNPLMMAFERAEEITQIVSGEEKANLMRRRVACIPMVANYNDLAS
jgi:hypothetical protein